MRRMNPEVKVKWLAALRSGEYQQGVGTLTRLSGDGRREFCCLGVLCDLAVGVGQVTVVADPEDGWGHRAYGDERATSGLPEEVQEWAGLVEDNPIVEDNSLADLNDGGEASFTEIADLIDRNL